MLVLRLAISLFIGSSCFLAFCSGCPACVVFWSYSSFISWRGSVAKTRARPPARRAGLARCWASFPPLVADAYASATSLVHSVPPFGGARRCRGSRYARHIGCRYAPVFCRLPRPSASAGVSRILGSCGAVALRAHKCGYPPPLRRMMLYFRHFAGAHAARTPLYLFPVGGAAPVNPCPRSARGGAVFFIVLAAGADRPQIGRKPPRPHQPPSRPL